MHIYRNPVYRFFIEKSLCAQVALVDKFRRWMAHLHMVTCKNVSFEVNILSLNFMGSFSSTSPTQFPVDFLIEKHVITFYLSQIRKKIPIEVK